MKFIDLLKYPIKLLNLATFRIKSTNLNIKIIVKIFFYYYVKLLLIRRDWSVDKADITIFYYLYVKIYKEFPALLSCEGIRFYQRFYIIFRKYKRIYAELLTSITLKVVLTFRIIVNTVKWLLLPILLSVFYFLISVYYLQIDFTKQAALWFIIGTIYYLLMSTFNSFLVKYRYGKFTSAIQRFWKRTGIIFWLVEGFLFLLFFYYFLNSSQEPLYMFDYSNLNNELLIQLKSTYKNLILLSLAIFLSFALMFKLNYWKYKQQISVLLIITLIIYYSFYIESYQFIYIISIFGDKVLIFDDMYNDWTLEIEQNNLRVKQHYFILCLVAKYWHFIFIFVSWFFFFIKSIENGKISYTMLGYNSQNLIILYVLNLLCLIQWVKHASKKFLDITYYWFDIQSSEKIIQDVLSEFFNLIINILPLKDVYYCVVDNFLLKSIDIFYCDEFDLWKFI